MVTRGCSAPPSEPVGAVATHSARAAVTMSLTDMLWLTLTALWAASSCVSAKKAEENQLTAGQQAHLAGGNKDPRGAGLCACGGAEGGGKQGPGSRRRLPLVRLSVIGGVHSFVVCS